jgi:hypothetical protein
MTEDRWGSHDPVYIGTRVKEIMAAYGCPLSTNGPGDWAYYVKRIRFEDDEVTVRPAGWVQWWIDRIEHDLEAAGFHRLIAPPPIDPPPPPVDPNITFQILAMLTDLQERVRHVEIKQDRPLPSARASLFGYPIVLKFDPWPKE